MYDPKLILEPFRDHFKITLLYHYVKIIFILLDMIIFGCKEDMIYWI